MGRRWTFGEKIGIGFAAVVALAVSLGASAIYNLRSVVAAKDAVIDGEARRLIRTAELRVLVERKSASARGYLLTGEARYLAELRQTRADLLETTAVLVDGVVDGEHRRMIQAIERSEIVHQDALERVMQLRRTST